jgi:NTE family protein
VADTGNGIVDRVRGLGRALFGPAGLFRSGPNAKTVALALQGGGSHGAFTWGVLDRLLEDERLAIESLSGASAGAINAAVLASGYLAGGRAGAKSALASLWQSVGEVGRLSPLGSNPLAHLLGGEFGAWLTGGGMRVLTRLASPYQLNPLDLNPLRNLIEELVDFERLRRSRKIRLFVSATNVHTGSPRVFTNRELSSNVLLASACLPTLHRAVEIEGAHYWDGGFSANPAIFPLVRHGRSEDIVIVHIDTQGHVGVPVTGHEITSRLERIMTNAPLIREIQMITDLRTLAAPGSEIGRRFDSLALHHILPPEAMTQFESSSKLNTDLSFLGRLRDIGRATATSWLAENFDKIGTGSAANLEASLFAPQRGTELAHGRA